jgi:hypothetical protein
MVGFVEYAGTLTPSDTFSTPEYGKPLYSAFKIDAAGTVTLFAADGSTIPASEYTGGEWHCVLFAGVKATTTDAATVQVGWLKRTDLQGLSTQGWTPN